MESDTTAKRGDPPMVPKVVLRQRRVMTAARALFGQRGFHATGMAQISSAAGIKIGQIYRDFAGKEAIVAEIVRTDLAEFLDEDTLRAAVDRDDSAAVHDWLIALLRREGDAARFQLLPEILAEAARNDAIARLFRATDEKVRTTIHAALDALAPGDARAARREGLTALILMLMIGASQRLLSVPDLDPRALTECCVGVVERELDALIA